MPAGIQVYAADGTLQFDSTMRVLRVLSESDAHPSSDTYLDAEINTAGTLPPLGREGVTVTNGKVQYGETRTRHSVILY